MNSRHSISVYKTILYINRYYGINGSIRYNGINAIITINSIITISSIIYINSISIYFRIVVLY